ncbi:MAG: hypothetical protein K6E13_10530 [Lachnospiraceae bacterium]|nr:hypothetical protein [Lachnospiraceae bacterium]
MEGRSTFAKDHIKSYTISALKKTDIVKNGALFTTNLFARNPIVAPLAADIASRSGLKIYDKKLKKKRGRNINMPFYEKEGCIMILEVGIVIACIAGTWINGLIVAHNADKKHLDHA